ncbi:MAG: hypothetical protein AAF597_17335, partial [Bacteroidota bacterium]
EGGVTGYAGLAATIGLNGATIETNEVDCAETNSWWYAYTAPATARYFVKVGLNPPLRDGANNDFSFGVYTGDAHPLTPISCVDDQPDVEQDTVLLTEGTTYYLRVGARPKSATDESYVFIEQLPVVWTGAVNNDWYEAGNWQGNAVPAANEVVVIPPSANDPILATGNVVLASLEVQTGGVFSLAQGASLTLMGGVNGLNIEGKVNIDGGLLVGDQENNGILSRGTIRVGPNGYMEVKGESVDILADSLVCAGTVELRQGALLDLNFSTTLLVEESGNISIIDAGVIGMIARGKTNIRGNLTVAEVLVGIIYEGEEFNIAETGSVTVSDCGPIGIQYNQSGLEIINAGQLTVTGTAVRAIDGGTTVNTATATFSVAGVVDGDVSFATGSRFEVGGTDPGCVTFTLNPSLSGATVALQIEGTTACTDYD